jgi:hypothetical protein
MDAVSATIIDGRRVILLKTQRSIKKKFSFIVRVTKVFFSAAALTNPLDGSPERWIGQIHQIHAIEGANGSATMVTIFIALFVVCGGWTRDITSSVYVEKYQEISLQ